MRKGYLLGMYGSFLCMIFLTLSSCNSNQTVATSPDTTAVMVDTPVKAAAARMTPISGLLHILYIDAATFVNLRDSTKGKITFRFLLQSPDVLTLAGWSNDSTNQKYPGEPPKPNITLLVGNSSGFEMEPGNYLGNLVLYNKTIKKVAKEIRDGATFVLFIPMNPDEISGQINYYVRTTTHDPQSVKISDFKDLVGGTDQTNPSPPRGAFN